MKAYFSGDLSAPLCGVVRFYVQLDGIKGVPADLIVVLDGAAVRVRIDKSARFDEGVAINIHTHLLSNGSHELTFKRTKLLRKEASECFRFDVCNQGDVAEAVRRSLANNGAPLVFAGHCDSAMYDYADAGLAPWFNRDDAEHDLSRRVASGIVPAEYEESLRTFIRKGYAILPQTVPEDMVERAVAALDDAVKSPEFVTFA